MMKIEVENLFLSLDCRRSEAMESVIRKFFVASMVMWMAPIAIIYGFKKQIFPGIGQLSSSSQTLLSGFLAVISVNLVILFYIVMAMKEPTSSEPQPDPAFIADARASINKAGPITNNEDQTRQKVE